MGLGMVWWHRTVCNLSSQQLSQEDEVFEAIHLGLYIKTLAQQRQQQDGFRHAW